MSAEAGECIGTEWGPNGEGARNPTGDATLYWGAEGEFAPKNPELGDWWGNIAGEGFIPGREGGEAREKPLVAGLDTKPPCPLVWNEGGGNIYI